MFSIHTVAIIFLFILFNHLYWFYSTFGEWDGTEKCKSHCKTDNITVTIAEIKMIVYVHCQISLNLNIYLFKIRHKKKHFMQKSIIYYILFVKIFSWLKLGNIYI